MNERIRGKRKPILDRSGKNFLVFGLSCGILGFVLADGRQMLSELGRHILFGAQVWIFAYVFTRVLTKDND